jgi:internalin A
MKKILLHIVVIFISLSGYAQTVPIPDAAFLDFLQSNYAQTINGSDELIISEAAQITGTLSCNGLGITNLDGVQYFSQVSRLLAYSNDIVSIPSLVGMTNLQTLHLYDNALTSRPDFSGLLKLKTVLIYQNNLTQFPVFGNNPAMEEIIASQNAITSIQSLSNLTNLLKLDVGQNQLTALPDFSSNINLQELICWSNQIAVLPSMKALTDLTRLNAGKNNLTQTPDLSANTQMSILAFDNNFLTEGPNLSLMNGLTSVKLYNNYLSFEDLLPYTTIPGFASNFDVTPMKPLPCIDTVRAYYDELANVSTGIDETVSNVTYTWMEGTSTIATVTNDTVQIKEASGSSVTQRFLYATLTHPSIPDLTLITDSIVVKFYSCPGNAAVKYTTTRTDCSNSGTIKVDIQGYVAPHTTYQLHSESLGENTFYHSNYMSGLIDTAYTLHINFSPTCSLDYINTIKMPFVDCKEVFITPNGDGDMDTYFITGTGNAVIYDKNGKEVKRVNLPYEWNGYGSNGLVSVGYYIIVINGGKDRLYISVLY